MIPTKIFLDLDDVLNKFTLYALQHVGCPIDSAKGYEQYDSKYGWDIVKAANALHPAQIRGRFPQFTVRSFWDCFDEDTWSNVLVSDELPFLLEACEELVGWDNICILTAPVLSPGCAQGKINWIREHLPKWLYQQYFIGPCKRFCAQPNALLIDDADHNIDAFQKAGGQVLTVPRPWNCLRDKDSMKYLGNAFQGLLKRKRSQQNMKHEVEPSGRVKW